MRELASAIIWQGIGPAARSFAEQSGVRGEELPEVIVTQGDLEVSPKVKEVKPPEVLMEVHPKGGLDEGCGTITDVALVGSSHSDLRSEPHSIAKGGVRKGRKLQLRISKNPEAQARIKELWETTDLTREKIAESIDYPRATVQKWINVCLEDGRLQPRDSDQKP